jgi:guanylate kinase
LLKVKKKGVLIVISSPSGAGKTTIAKKLTSKKSNIELSVSLTTRKPRAGEVDSIDYKFVSPNFFKQKIKQNAFLENAKVFDNFYGTLKKQIESKLNKGKNILLDIDWQGARQVKKRLPNDTITIFILPPSLKELEKRLKKRERSISFVKKRMSKAKQEIMHWTEYDYAVVNKDLNSCLNKIKNILQIDSCKPRRQVILKS